MAFWSGIVTVNCSVYLPAPAPWGPPSFLGGPVGCCFSLSSSVAVWSSGCLSLLFAIKEGGLGACPYAQWGGSPAAAVVWLSGASFSQV